MLFDGLNRLQVTTIEVRGSFVRSKHSTRLPVNKQTDLPVVESLHRCSIIALASIGTINSVGLIGMKQFMNAMAKLGWVRPAPVLRYAVRLQPPSFVRAVTVIKYRQVRI
jgi:hypothetical protein